MKKTDMQKEKVQEFFDNFGDTTTGRVNDKISIFKDCNGTICGITGISTKQLKVLLKFHVVTI